MRLTRIQTDRAGGVLLGQAIGDAMGVPYEFAPAIPAGQARMNGGGLGPYAPGEWSDDTQMAICIAQVAATGADLTTEVALDAVAQAFLDWQANGASDIGVQTANVLREARAAAGPLAGRMTAAAERLAAAGRAGNGALMRTAIVGVTALADAEHTALAAARVAALTHADARCVESCVLWSEAVRVAVIDGHLDLRAGLQLLDPARRGQWAKWIDEAETQPPASFARNGYTVTALQAAWASIWSTRHVTDPDQVTAALQTAIAIGHDTDTIAAIAGGLLGARYGVSGLPADLARRVHGWPKLRGRDLVGLALATATGHRAAQHAGASMITGRGRPLAVPHPEDPDVLLGTEADLARSRDLGVTAVVSLSRVGAPEIAAAGVAPHRHAEVWLIDSDHPDDNAHLAWTLTDAARTIARFRDTGHRVLLHCVAAEHRTPAVALAYSRLLGATPGASRRIEDAVGHRVDGLLWETAAQTVVGLVGSGRRSAVLRDLRDARGNHFFLEVRLLEDGSVEFAAQDLGPVTAPVSADGEWRTVDARHVPQLVRLLGGEPGEPVIELLARHWAGGRSFDLEDVLREAPFPVRLHTC